MQTHAPEAALFQSRTVPVAAIDPTAAPVPCAAVADAEVWQKCGDALSKFAGTLPRIARPGKGPGAAMRRARNSASSSFQSDCVIATHPRHNRVQFWTLSATAPINEFKDLKDIDTWSHDCYFRW